MVSFILPILFVFLPHRMVDRFMWVRSHISSYALTSLSLPRFSTTYCHIRDLLIQFEVPVDYPWSSATVHGIPPRFCDFNIAFRHAVFWRHFR